MNKVIVSEFISTDGVIEAPGPDGSAYKYAGWTMPYGNDQFIKFKYNELMSGNALLLGRTTYEGFASAWPNMKGDEFSDKMNNMPKYVVSSTLKAADWTNAHLITSDLQKEITKLKQSLSGDILVFGSGQLVRGLLEEGLVDELRLMTYPIILGTGKRLFDDAKKVPLKLIHTETFDTGVVVLSYEPQPDRKED
jgi:dihydrofolate reductase